MKSEEQFVKYLKGKALCRQPQKNGIKIYKGIERDTTSQNIHEVMIAVAGSV